MGHTVRCASLDVNVNSFPEGLEYASDLPRIYFFPAYHKQMPYEKYIGKGMAGDILIYL